MSALALALGYVARGWSPVPVPYKTKKPTIPGWQRLRIKKTDAPRYFNCGPLNVGVLLGPPSSGLTDVDLDCAEALAVAPYLLPKTGAIFGRASRPASHWLYTSSIAQSTDTTVLNFDDPTLGNDESRIVELRIGADETGAQTVFPGSTHESGEAIKWAEDTGPARIGDEELVGAVRRVAAAALLARYWPGQGGRHDAGRALGGFLARAGWNTAEIGLFAEAVARAACDPEWKDRRTAARDQAEAYNAGKHTFGFPKLKELFGEQVAKAVAEWLKYEYREPGDNDNATGKGNSNCEIDLVRAEPVSFLHRLQDMDVGKVRTGRFKARAQCVARGAQTIIQSSTRPYRAQ